MSEVYDTSPAMAHVALDDADVDRLLATDGRFFTRDASRVRHLLSRMRATLNHHATQMRALHSDVERIAASGRGEASPLSAAVAALSRLSVDEQRTVFDIHAAALADRLREAAAEARTAKTAAASQSNGVRFLLGELAADPDVPDTVRARLLDAAKNLPHVAPAVEPTLPASLVGLAAPQGASPFTVAAKDDVAGALFGDDVDERPALPASPSA